MSWSLHLSAYLDENPDFVEAGWKAEPVFRWLLALDVRRGFEGRIPAAYSTAAFISAQRRMPVDDVTEALGDMEGKLVHRYPDGSLEILPHPDWEQPRTPKQRQAAKRYRDKSAAAEAKRAQLSLSVTGSHEASRNVTDGHAVDRDVTPPDPLPDPLPLPEKPFARGRARDLGQDEAKACGSSSPAGAEPREPEGLRRERVGATKKPADLTLFKEHFLEAFRAASGASHTWAGPEAGIGTRMLAAGLEDAQGRVTFAFADDSPLGWIPAAARDLRTLQTHWNKLAGWRTATRGARASPARDPRVGQAPPSERFSGGEVKL